ncbi:minor tail protein [Rhodococcus phage ReqiPine5]|uniref:Gp29 n=1 Tax=Rhodococcus phage ReqiPine5 TaxID=691963 RepID=D4P804_9CAUD|nr:minor tail protein [Rhodococcus phage ReqiPine5]ADD81134.1 gp29 [Rhodococcus phage ReqiPine5]
MRSGDGASVSIHTADGAAVAEFTRSSLSALEWGRRRRDVSQCDLTVTEIGDQLPALENITPWYHWVSVWEFDDLVWTGPILSSDLGRNDFIVSARDVSTFAWRTRAPFARRWASQTTVVMAAELFRAMLDLRSLDHVRVRTFATPDLVEYDYALAPDTRSMNNVIDDLVKMGLNWTVVAGTLVIGTIPPNVTAVLDEQDILSEIRIRKDGSKTYTDVRVQGQNYAHVETVPGPILQNVVNLDNLRGVGNIQRATREYVAQTGRVAESMIIPSGASLSPDAPVTLPMLLPGARFNVYLGEDRAAAVDLTEMKAVLTAEGYDVQVTLDAPPLTTELERAGVSS